MLRFGFAWVRAIGVTITATTNPVAAVTAFSVCRASSSSSMLRGLRAKTTTTTATATSRMSSSSTIEVVQIPCLSDNYGYLLHHKVTGETAAIDTPDVYPYQQILQDRQWTLTHILNTHHHSDHTGGNIALKQQPNGTSSKAKPVTVYGPATEQIPGRDIAVQGGDVITFGTSTVHVLDVGGHTKGHIAYYFPDDNKVFVGDSLFALGCGRMFEGTAIQFWESLQRLRNLPDNTEVYCAHEYTVSNAKFAASIEPGNVELMQRVAEVNDLRQRNLPTVPSMLGVEKRTNPFLRCDISTEIRKNVGASPNDPDHVVFAKVRKAKDNF